MTGIPSEEAMKEYVSLLGRIGVLLERNGCSFQKELIDKLISSLKEGTPLTILTSNDIWGGSGSVTDCNLRSESSPQPKPDAEKDEMEFRSLIAKLAERMCEHGIANERVKSVGGTYSRWALK